MIIYGCLAQGRAEAEALLALVRQLVHEDTIGGVQLLDPGDGAVVGLRRGGGRAVLSIRRLDPALFASLQSNEPLDHGVLFSPSDPDTPDDVGLCWEVLVALNTFYPSAVWISSRAYGAATVSRVAPIRKAGLDGEQGHLLSAAEVADLIETPV